MKRRKKTRRQGIGEKKKRKEKRKRNKERKERMEE